jgi:hypothetical protein
MIEKPECKRGYTEAQAKRILGDRYKEFCRWMIGKTIPYCNGKDCTDKHGLCIYPADLDWFAR